MSTVIPAGSGSQPDPTTPKRCRGRARGKAALAKFLDGMLARQEAREDRAELEEAATAKVTNSRGRPQSKAEQPAAGWGQFWPAEFVAEYDDVYLIAVGIPLGEEPKPFEPTSPRIGDYVVCSYAGEVLFRFQERWRARGALNRCRKAGYVICEGTVVFRREDAAVVIGEKAGLA